MIGSQTGKLSRNMFSDHKKQIEDKSYYKQKTKLFT